MFNVDKAHLILDEMIANGQITKTNKNRVLAPVLCWTKPASDEDINSYHCVCACVLFHQFTIFTYLLAYNCAAECEYVER